MDEQVLIRRLEIFCRTLIERTDAPGEILSVFIDFVTQQLGSIDENVSVLVLHLMDKALSMFFLKDIISACGENSNDFMLKLTKIRDSVVNLFTRIYPHPSRVDYAGRPVHVVFDIHRYSILRNIYFRLDEISKIVILNGGELIEVEFFAILSIVNFVDMVIDYKGSAKFCRGIRYPTIPAPNSLPDDPLNESVDENELFEIDLIRIERFISSHQSNSTSVSPLGETEISLCLDIIYGAICKINVLDNLGEFEKIDIFRHVHLCEHEFYSRFQLQNLYKIFCSIKISEIIPLLLRENSEQNLMSKITAIGHLCSKLVEFPHNESCKVFVCLADYCRFLYAIKRQEELQNIDVALDRSNMIPTTSMADHLNYAMEILPFEPLPSDVKQDLRLKFSRYPSLEDLKNAFSNYECVVCKEDLSGEVDREIAVLPCCHITCFSCIILWFFDGKRISR